MKTYFFQGTRALPVSVQERVDKGDACQLAPHLCYLGSSGVTIVHGFRVAFCGGAPTMSLEDASTSTSSFHTPEAATAAAAHLLQHPSFALGSARAPAPPTDDSLQQARVFEAASIKYCEQLAADVDVIQAREPIDFLFTNIWPQGIEQISQVPLPDASAPFWGSTAVSRLAEAARPRYHFAAAPTQAECDKRLVHLDDLTRSYGAFWEREPYENPPFAALPPPGVPSITRFVSLAHAANAHKIRWFRALDLVPSDDLLNAAGKMQARPANTTLCPLLVRAPPKRAADVPAQVSPRFDMSHKRARYEGKRKQRREKQGVVPVSPENCWFCLSNPRSEKHLVVSVGEECYIALPKGQLPISADETTLVPGGGHVLIIPILHTASMYAPGSEPLRAEVSRWKEALRKCYAAYDAVPVTFEVRRSGTRAGHTHTQVLPIARSQIDDLEAFFHDAATQDELAFEEDAVADAFAGQGDVALISAQDRDDYCYIELDRRRLLLLLRGTRFNLQFPRETLAAFMDMPERGDWKACVREEEIESVERDEVGLC